MRFLPDLSLGSENDAAQNAGFMKSPRAASDSEQLAMSPTRCWLDTARHELQAASWAWSRYVAQARAPRLYDPSAPLRYSYSCDRCLSVTPWRTDAITKHAA